MFSSVTSFFFGGSAEPEPEPVEVQLTPAPENEWVLVDLPEKSPVPSLIHTPTCSDSESDNQRSSNNGSPCSQGSPVSHTRFCLHSKKGCYHESWIITPPPCFLAGGSNSSNVQMTPMENLLIEHPSMSVYNSRCSGSTGEASDLSESSNDDGSPSTRKVLARKAKTVPQQAPRKPNAVAARAGIMAQIDSVKSSQRSLKQIESKKLSRRNLQRLNRALNHQMGGGKPYNKSGRINCPAGRSNSQMKH